MRKSKTLYVFIIIISAFALLLSLYLTFAHYSTSQPLCFSIFGFNAECDAVNQGSYSEMLGIPTAFFGVIGFLLIFLLSLIKLCDYDVQNQWVKDELGGYAHTVMFVLCFIGLLFSVYLIYLQGFVLEAGCSLCRLAVLSMILLFLLSIGNLFVDI